MNYLRFLGLAAAVLAAPAAAPGAPKAAEPEGGFCPSGVHGVERIGEREYVVANNIFHALQLAMSDLPLDAVAFYRRRDSDKEDRRRVFDVLAGKKYDREEAECLAGIFSEKDNIVVSRMAYSGETMRHERMHRNWHNLPEEKRGKLEEQWWDALLSGKIKTYLGLSEECDQYCREARSDPDHFFVYWCQGRIPGAYSVVMGVGEIVEEICER